MTRDELRAVAVRAGCEAPYLRVYPCEYPACTCRDDGVLLVIAALSAADAIIALALARLQASPEAGRAP